MKKNCNFYLLVNEICRSEIIDAFIIKVVCDRKSSIVTVVKYFKYDWFNHLIIKFKKETRTIRIIY